MSPRNVMRPQLVTLSPCADGRMEICATTGSLHYRYALSLREQWQWATMLLDSVRRQVGELDPPALREPAPLSHRELAERDMT